MLVRRSVSRAGREPRGAFPDPFDVGAARAHAAELLMARILRSPEHYTYSVV